MKNTLKLPVSIYFLTSIANTNIQINKKAIIVVYGSNLKRNL